MRHTVSIFVCLAVLWLLLSGHYNALLLGLGTASCLLVTWLARRMAVVDSETQPLHLARRLPLYWLWLAREIAKANWDVVRCIVSPSLPISPTMQRIAAHEKTELGQTIFANSITLTPGTVSVSLVGGTVEVHGLARSYVEAVTGGEMQRRIVSMERAVTSGSGGA